MADEQPDNPQELVWVESMFGANTKQALVTIKLKESTITVTSADARRIAYNILGGAEAADHDAIVYRAGMAKLGMSPREMGKFMWMMREVRKEIDAEKAQTDGT